MKKDLSEVDRLDVAARSLVTEAYISGIRVCLIFFSISIISSAMEIKGSFYTVLTSRVLAILFALISVSFWFSWRYKVYALTILPVVWMAGFMLKSGFPRHWLVWLAGSSITLLLIYRTWKGASPRETAQCEGWEKEHAQVAQWLSVLQNTDLSADVFEFNGGSFWVGYHTYRLMKTERCWVVAKFRKGYLRRPLEYRTLELDAVFISLLPEGKLNIAIGGRTKWKVSASPKMLSALQGAMHLVG
jgi:hypothetical protein